MTDQPQYRRLKAPFDVYLVYSDGRVYSEHTKRFLAEVLINSGYKTVNLYTGNQGHRQLIHRLVAEYFVPNPYGYNVVNHIDGNRLNNHYTNLEWTSQRNNLFSAQKMQLMKDRSIFPYEIINFRTGESYLFTNYNEALKYLGLNPARYCYNAKLRPAVNSDDGSEYFHIEHTDWYIRVYTERLLTDFDWLL